MDPGCTEQTAAVVLKPHKARPFFGRHPWVLARAVDRLDGPAKDGDVVELRTDTGRFIASGIYQSHGSIAVRLYSWLPDELLDEAFWRRRLQAAINLRQQLGWLGGEEACRLVYSEADGLSGLVVDRYGPYLVVQLNALGMWLRRATLVSLLQELVRPTAILLRADPQLAKAEGLGDVMEVALGTPPEGLVEIQEHGLRYRIDLFHGQKTGFYLDQRENRRVAANYLRGRRVLDLFCYSGGFSLCAASLGKASAVLGIDSSATAIGWARQNAEHNGITNVDFLQEKAFQALDRLQQAGERFGAVILDPPKFCRNRYGVNDALRAYHRLNRVALELLEPGGILVTCSCSGGVTPDDFLLMLAGVAEKSGRDLQILEQRGAAPDHPLRPTCLENDYLKCFICRATD